MSLCFFGDLTASSFYSSQKLNIFIILILILSCLYRRIVRSLNSSDTAEQKKGGIFFFLNFFFVFVVFYCLGPAALNSVELCGAGAAHCEGFKLMFSFHKQRADREGGRSGQRCHCLNLFTCCFVI